MPEQDIKPLVAQGLQALKAASQIAKKAINEIENDAKHPELKETLRKGDQVADGWAERIDAALREVGGGKDEGNPILDAHYEVSRRIRQQAPNDLSRDLGIVAAGQLALHYWIAAFGTLRTYASAVGLSGVERSMQQSLDEAKQGDQQHTALAEKLLAA